MNGRAIDFTHHINHLSFGSLDAIKTVKARMKSVEVAPLDGMIEEGPPVSSAHSRMYTNYYLSIMPTQYNFANGDQFSAHEFTFSQ